MQLKKNLLLKINNKAVLTNKMKKKITLKIIITIIIIQLKVNDINHNLY